MVATRFAPSPTGQLHIGGARTALFNWLFARHYGGRFLLRIEDTDRERSETRFIKAILDDLKWLDLIWDEDVVYQSERLERHREIAHRLLDKKRAYRCYCTPEELKVMRDRARAEGKPQHYDGSCRDRDISAFEGRLPSVVRFRGPKGGKCEFEDAVRGSITISDTQMDDLVLLRADDTPTYMLSVVVDDHDMGVSNIIRGEDHLTNAARQLRIYQALGWKAPAFAHIPLIHRTDGEKLAKRHESMGVRNYREAGYLPEAVRNYLARLGWSHGNEEKFSSRQAIEWFSLKQVGRSAARFDATKLAHLNGLYLREENDDVICSKALALSGDEISDLQKKQFLALIPALKLRASTLQEIVEGGKFLLRKRPLEMDEKALTMLKRDGSLKLLEGFRKRAEIVAAWEAPALEEEVRKFAKDEQVKLGTVAQPLRAALTGRTVSAGIFDVLEVLGREESLARIADVLTPPK